METEFHFALDGVRGRETRRLSPQFALRGFCFEGGLREELLKACGDANEFGLRLGRALYRHSCGVWGPMPLFDRALNEHILNTRHDGHTSGRWVVSRHTVAGVPVEFATEITTGETRVRRPAPSPRKPQ